MLGSKRLASLLLLGVLAASPAAAQVAGHPVEFSVGGGLAQFDARDHVEGAPLGTASLAYRWSTGLSFEASWLTASSQRRPEWGGNDLTYSWTGLDLRWSLRDPSERMTPYLLTGLGFGRSQVTDDAYLTRRGAPSAGVGLLMSVMDRERLYLRLQVRDVFLREGTQTGFSNHIAASVGLQWVFRGKSKDQDLDGVRNWVDQCAGTPIGAKVDAKGCPIDSDKDGVFDGLDKCEGTPIGAKVDKNGCPIDSDGDGVADGIDACEKTPKGARVDAKGCPLDTDGDGVYDGLDQCEGTPKGAVIDAKGCPVDTDGDGVADGIDQCPNTPAGTAVNEAGCPTQVGAAEMQLLDSGVLRVTDLAFLADKAGIKAEGLAVLDTVATLLLQYPSLTFEVGVHSDNSIPAARSLELSEKRAKAVLGYLTQKFPTLDAGSFTTAGFGSKAPIAPNSTGIGRAKNRRVEFKVTNPDVLQGERTKRGMVAPVTTPADSTGS